ncbi:hypothetical protein LIER_01601 [Lithospermum erythrorhizon]|uniref:Uncharacterized protein n=1 Tax=Lithospermum erythrorhizon TaxID=34254 RepID=A0AAV3NMI5_LITER
MSSTCSSSCCGSMYIISTKTTSILGHVKNGYSIMYKWFPCVVYKSQRKSSVNNKLLSVSASVGSVLLTSGNLAAAGGGSSLHGAVTSAITQVAVTAVAIASGACLSTKVDFLWPKMDELPGMILIFMCVLFLTVYRTRRVAAAGQFNYC